MNRRNFLTHSAAAVAAGVLLPRSSRAAAPDASGTLPSEFEIGPKPVPVVKPGEFNFAVAHLDHYHIDGICQCLIDAGATMKWVYDPDTQKVAAFLKGFPGAQAARSIEEILQDPDIKLVTSAAIPSERGALGCRVMKAGKDYFTDKAPFTSLEQLEQARAVVAQTGRKYLVNYGERVHSECAMFGVELIKRGAIGKVIQIINVAPHRLDMVQRPAWFFEKAKFGGVLVDLGSNQVDQFLAYSAATDATVTYSSVGNLTHPEHPEFEDFGEIGLIGDNGTINYSHVDWLTPAGLSTWGDVRTFILGTKGSMELRKNVNLATEKSGDHILIADARGEHHLAVEGKVGFRFSGDLILDVLNRTEHAITQAYAFKVSEISLRAEMAARRMSRV